MANKPKILVVDDEAVITDAARKILGAEGFAVRTTADAEKAMLLIPSELPEIAFLDLMLPGLSGMDLLERIKHEYPQMVVVMMTGYSTLDNAISFLKNGAFDYLPKPFEYEELLSTAQRADRFVSLRAAGSFRCVERSVPCYLLGVSSWAKTNSDGTVSLGITDLFRQIVGPIENIELPAVGYDIRQGSLLAQIVAQDESRHTVWSAMSGRIIELNPALQGGRESLNRDPQGLYWLVRIIPENLEGELINLSASPMEQGS